MELRTTVLRAHEGEVHALSFLPPPAGRIEPLLASGAADGTLALWEPGCSASPVRSWRAHEGGLLALSPWEGAPAGTVGLFSQGRDGALHAWAVGLAGGGGGASSEEEDPLAGLHDLLLPLPSPSLTPPVRVWTLTAGSGGFCRLSRRGPYLALPSTDASAVDVWACGAGSDPPTRLGTAAVSADAASAVARALGRGGEEEGGSGQPSPMLSCGMLMAVALLPAAAGGANARRVGAPPPAARPVPPPARGSLRELLQGGTVSPAPLPLPLSPPAHSSVPLLAAYENGGVYVLEAGGGAEGPDTALLAVPVSPVPLTALALGPPRPDGSVAAIVCTSGLSLFVLRLCLGTGVEGWAAAVTHVLPLSGPGSGAALALPGGRVVAGGWDGSLRILPMCTCRGLGGECGLFVRCHRWQSSSIHALAVWTEGGGIAVGTADGRVTILRGGDD
jgi:hypothetical protein